MTAARDVTRSLVIASNRGPVELREDDAGEVVAHRGGGGLIAVLGPAAATARGLWVAHAMTPADARAARRADAGDLVTVELPEGPVDVRMVDHDPLVYDDYYGVVSTELLWFLQHQLFDLTREPIVDRALRAAWANYENVNDHIAAVCSDHAVPHGTVLFQDYHLSVAPRRLRARRPDVRSAHFTMTPWAEPAYFATLPHDLRHTLVDGLLGADMVCFLVPRWRDAFLACCVELGFSVDHRRHAVLDADRRSIAVRCFPVGVDGDQLRARAAQADVLERRAMLADRVGERQIVLRIDRMDPAKNILRGLAAFAELLEREPRRHGKVVHIVHAYASRADLAPYRRYAGDVHDAVRLINERFGDGDWQPVILETVNDFALGLAAMAVADVLVVNPSRDGMNLVAKEGAVLSERDVALILSRGAGAADDLAAGCVQVDPFDVSELSAQISAALDLPSGKRKQKLERLREGATRLPPRAWLAAALAELDRVRPGGIGSTPPPESRSTRR